MYKPQFCDERDGKKYVYVTIGTQVWMAENLNYGASGGCCYYNWATAMNLPSSCNGNICASQVFSTHRGLCPEGWHIPSNADWGDLTTTVGGESTAGKKLKAASGWNNNGNGTDDYGFSALPGGYRDTDHFRDAGDIGYWWSASEYGSGNAYYRYMDYSYGASGIWSNTYKGFGFSVRCLKD
jgi:uncharacterized protein (TIGR02145 family)